MPPKLHARIPAKEITYTLLAEQEDLPVRGNALASGDDAEDRKAEEEILSRLDDGDIWAWAAVTVTASWAGFTGSAHLGGCSYRDEEDFKTPGGYYDDMKREAADDLASKVEDAFTRARPAMRR